MCFIVLAGDEISHIDLFFGFPRLYDTGPRYEIIGASTCGGELLPRFQAQHVTCETFEAVQLDPLGLGGIKTNPGYCVNDVHNLSTPASLSILSANRPCRQQRLFDEEATLS